MNSQPVCSSAWTAHSYTHKTYNQSNVVIQGDLCSVFACVCVRVCGRTLGACQSERLLNMSFLEQRTQLAGVIPGHSLLCFSTCFLPLRSNMPLTLCLFLGGAKASGNSVCLCVCMRVCLDVCTGVS